MFKAEKNKTVSIRGINMLTDDDLEQFEEINRFFVDSSGWGIEGEAALTINQFLEKVKAGKYYAIIEAGQFQVYVGEYIERKTK